VLFVELYAHELTDMLHATERGPRLAGYSWRASRTRAAAGHQRQHDFHGLLAGRSGTSSPTVGPARSPAGSLPVRDEAKATLPGGGTITAMSHTGGWPSQTAVRLRTSPSLGARRRVRFVEAAVQRERPGGGGHPSKDDYVALIDFRRKQGA